MSYQEKRSYVQFVGNLLGFILYSMYLINNIEGSTFNLSEFGKFTLLLVPVLILVQIITKIVFDIFNQTDEKGEEPKFMDELDYNIELRAVRNFSFVFLFGFFLSMLLLWLEVALLTVFIVLLGFIFLAGSTLELSYVYYYRKGV